MGSLATLFGNAEPEDKEQDSEKLMDLYWNRAELKKAYAESRNEQFRLKDRIKHHEGETARVQQKLEQIEDLLLEPESALNVVVLYLLRGLAMRCEGKLAQFAEQLKQQQEKKQFRNMMARWNSSNAEDCAKLEEQMIVLSGEIKHGLEQQTTQQAELDSMGWFKKLFRGRSVTREINSLVEKNIAAQAEEQALLDELKLVGERTPPETLGLDDQSKRLINLMIISYAQQLFLQFSDPSFASLVKESVEKSAGGVSYGNPQECKKVLEIVQRRIEALEKSTDDAVILQKRAKLIGEKAVFENNEDVIPAVASTLTVFDFAEEGRVMESSVPILGQNYWGISKVLSR